MFSIDNITLRQLNGFRMVAQLGSFTRAAQRLKIAQSALSLAVRDLESELNIRLFDRTTRKVELTVAGREFLQSIDTLLSGLETAVKNARDWTERKRGRLSIAVPPFLAGMIVPAAIANYKAAFPAIDIRLTDTRTEIIVEMVRSGEADFGVGTFSDSEEGIRREILFKDVLMAWGSPRLPVMRTSRLCWRDLSGASVIALSRQSGIRELMEESFEKIDMSAHPAFEVSHITTAITLAEAGLGIAILPSYVWGFARAFNVVSRPLFEPHVTRQVAIIRSSSRSLSPAAEEFTKFLRKQIKSVLPRSAKTAK